MESAMATEGASTVELNEQLSTLIKQEKTLANLDFNEGFLGMFMKYAKNRPEKAVERLTRYCAKVKERPQVFKWNSDLKKLVELNSDDMTICKTETISVICVKMTNWKSKKVTFDDMCHMIALFTSIDDNIQKHGYHLILDASDMTFFDACKMGVKNCLFLMEMIFMALPAKLHVIHVMFANRFFEMIFNMVKPFLGAKYVKRTIMHGQDIAELHKCCKPETLPAKFNGTFTKKIVVDEYLASLETQKPVLEPVWNQITASKSK